MEKGIAMTLRVNSILLFTLLALGCHRKNQVTIAHDPTRDEVAAIARFHVLEELESEDSMVASELAATDIENEIQVREEQILNNVDKNHDKTLDKSEQSALKTFISDRMLEKFDSDSNGSFGAGECRLLDEQIQSRLNQLHRLHPESFAAKKTFVCKIILERSQNPAEKLKDHPLYSNILSQCQM